ncbi:hypothetical protein F511_18287 [Dorcoceras hygrometricum]|uniref:Uncharacterized protein n=1 Tax=Dorcoceras hygrometricum TaxID=472368 RepID=A0A2Z7CN04_9LAMI|nr:hypothetical protein F511_18287 [Dorcoceras hygrometricum]
MEKGNREKRSPLQDLNGLILMNKADSEKSLNASSSRSKRPDFFSKSASNAPKDSAVASKAVLPRKPFLQKSKKNQLPRISEWPSGKISAKPMSKSGQISKPSVFDVSSMNNVKKKSKGFRTTLKNSQEACSEFDGKRNGLHEDSFSRTVDNLGAASTVKTPPVEASVSPDIQCPCPFDQKKIVSHSTEPTVCYGAGHLLSGVTDKRKCRRRGSLRGCEKVNLFHGELDEIYDSQDTSIPLLEGGSVRWHEGQGNDSRNMLDQCRMKNDSDSAVLDLPSSPSTLCEHASDSIWDDIISCSVSVSIGNVVNNKETGIIPHSPVEFQESLGPWNNEVDDSLLAVSPTSSSCGKAIIDDDSECSMVSLSSRNVIQTPNSGSDSELHDVVPNVEVDKRNLFQSTNDTISNVLSEEDIDFAASWISDSTLENLSLSETRISWRDGMFSSRNLDADEFDCCRCLSDEEIHGDQIYDQQLMTKPPSMLVEDKGNDLRANSDTTERCFSRTESGETEETNKWNDIDLSPPVVLEYETCISARGKEKLSPHRPNACAESICTTSIVDGTAHMKSDRLCKQCSACDKDKCPPSEAYPHMTTYDNTLIAGSLQSDYVRLEDKGVYSVPSIIGGGSRDNNSYFGWESTSGSASGYHRFRNYMDKCSEGGSYLTVDKHGEVRLQALKSLTNLADADWKSINPPPHLNHREFRYWFSGSTGKCLTVFKGEGAKKAVGIADCKFDGSNTFQLFAFRFHYHKAFCCCGKYNE